MISQLIVFRVWRKKPRIQSDPSSRDLRFGTSPEGNYIHITDGFEVQLFV